MLRRIIDLVKDRRTPHLLPYTIISKLISLEKLNNFSVENVLVSFTFDIEPSPVLKDTRQAIDFLKRNYNFLKKTNSTLFICGNMIKSIWRVLKKLEDSCELGLHGYAHELWGEQKWYITQPPLKRNEKIGLLKKSIEEFKLYNLVTPKSFRAPYLISNMETLMILSNFGFETDSSVPTYLTGSSIPFRRNNITILPVSVCPIPKIKLFPFPKVFFEMFTMENFCTFDEEKLELFIRLTSSVLLTRGFKPFIVFLAHPWEFYKNRWFNYCSKNNLKSLKKIFRYIRENYEAKFININELSKEVIR